MPLQRRVPKFGFKNPFRVAYRPINIGRLQGMIDAGKLDAGVEITPEVLQSLGITDKKDLVKILGTGDLTAAIKVTAHAFSAGARSKIEQAGGSATVLA
jgi:large subunit ribosomal protein L15